MGMGEFIREMDDCIMHHLPTDEVIKYRSGNFSPIAINGVFDKTYQLTGSGDVGLIDFSPGVFVRLSDLTSDPELDEDARVFVDNCQYKIRQVEKDGKGMAILFLIRS